MSLKRFLSRARMLIEQGLYETRQAFRTEDLSERALQVTQLEERILMSASPAAVVAAAPAEPAAAISQQDGPATFQETTSLTEQQYLDVIADQILPEAQTTTSATQSPDTQSLELVFLDSSISNLQQMINDLQQTAVADPSTKLEVIVLDASRDGIAQITSALLRYNGVDGMHIVSHGSAGQVQLGSTLLSTSNLDTYRSAISAWQYSMSDKADILFYGCDLAASDDGKLLLQELSILTDTDVSASEDLTGATGPSVDLTLNDQTGDFESEALVSYASMSNQVNFMVLQPVVSPIPAPELSLRTEIVFLDTGIHDYQQILADVQSRVAEGTVFNIVQIDADHDGLEQITQYLAENSQPVDAIHLIAHGTDRAFKLGNTWIDSNGLQLKQSEFQQWSRVLRSDADILFYGCDLAGSDSGISMLQQIAEWTGADIAASETLIGAESLGGNWLLEYEIGDIETQIVVSAALQAEWEGLLATFTVTNNNDSGAGSLRQAIHDANALAGGDTIRFAIAGDGLHTINLIDALPEITDTIIIDGFSQPVIINGSWTSAGSGLVLGAGSDGSWIVGIGVTGFTDAGLEIHNDSTVLVGNHLWGNNGQQLRIASTATDVDMYANLIGAKAEAFWNDVGGESVEADWHFAIQTSIDTDNPSIDQLQVADIVLIDLQLDDSEALISAVQSHALVFAYNSESQSAVEILNQVATWAENSGSFIETVSILSHGVEGAFQLGSTWMDINNISQVSEEWSAVAAHFASNASIYLLGCDVAGDTSGEQLVNLLAELTSADVFASSNVTGIDGDWMLEYASNGGLIAAPQGFASVFEMEELYAADVSLAWYNSSWGFRQTVTVSETMVTGSNNLSNFAVLVSITDTKLRSTGNGGNVGQTDGGDFVFTAADGVTKLDHEIESYDATTGALLAWVRVPTLSHNVNTNLYVYYGNASVANQWNTTGVWDSNTRAVWHLGADFNDSTVNANHGTNNGSTNNSSAKIGAGDTFNGTNARITVADSNSLDITSELTISGWFNSSDLSSFGSILEKGSENYYAGTNGTNFTFDFRNGGYNTQTSSGTGLVTGTWYHFATTYNDAANTVTTYINGTQIFTNTNVTKSLLTNSGALTIGSGDGYFFSGSLDEIRVDSTVRSADWIQAKYLNQNAPGTYVTVSAEEGFPAVNTAPTFGLGDGIVTTAIGTGDDVSYSATIQPDGKILMAGYSRIGSTDDFALIRYNADGSLDTSFGGGDGIVTTGIGAGLDIADSVTLQSDGKILVAGFSHNGSNRDFALIRYNADGSLDTSFGGGDGIVTTAIGADNDAASSVSVQVDGKIVVAGRSLAGQRQVL